MSADTVFHVAEDALARRAASPAEAQALAAALRRDDIWREVVPGLDSVTVLFDPLTILLEDAKAHLASAAPIAAHAHTAPPLIIPVTYGGVNGPDFDDLCAATGLSAEAFIAAHTAGLHTVDMIGFTPGFAYISGLDPRLSAARLATPRTSLPAGSVGLSAGYTGLYALQGPGGWPIIGRTDAPLFNADAPAPFLVQPGQTIRFAAA